MQFSKDNHNCNPLNRTFNAKTCKHLKSYAFSECVIYLVFCFFPTINQFLLSESQITFICVCIESVLSQCL